MNNNEIHTDEERIKLQRFYWEIRIVAMLAFIGFILSIILW